MIDHQRFLDLCGSPEASSDAMALAAVSLMTVKGAADGLPVEQRVAALAFEIGADPERAAAVLVNLAATVVTLLIAYGESGGSGPVETLRLLALAGQR